MNRYVRALFIIPYSTIKIVWTKFFHVKTFQSSLFCMISPFTEISIDNGGKLSIGKKFRMRDGAKIRVRKGGECKIGNNVSLGCQNIITCRNYIEIGNDVQLSPNVFIFDHDHDYNVLGGLKMMKYKTSPIKIGNNVWIGSNTVILRGTTVGDNSVIGAGSILKGNYPSNCVIIQKRITEKKIIKRFKEETHESTN